MRIIIVGGTAAGPAAAAEAKRVAPEAEVVMIEAGEAISVGACEIPSFLGQHVEANALTVLSPTSFERTRGASVWTHHRVTAIDVKRKRLTVQALDFGSIHDEPYDRLILATGARAKTLGLDGEEAQGVFAVRTLDDALRLDAWIHTRTVRHAVVVGAGYVGLEVAEAFRARGLRVSVLDPDGQVFRRTMTPSMVAPIQDGMRRAGVTLRAERVTGIETDRGGRVAALRTERGEVIGCQLVVVAVGIQPRMELTVAAGLKRGSSGALHVDAHMRTSMRDIWACGDAVEVHRVIDDRAVYWPLAPVARRTARVAARNAAGQRPSDRFHGITGSLAVKVFGYEAAKVGVDMDEARMAGFDPVAVEIEHLSRSKPQPEARPVRVRLLGDRSSGRLLGGELVGQEGAALRANVLVPLLRHRATVRELAEDTDLVYNPPIAPSVDPLKIAASQWLKAAERKRR